eukprot:s1767_g11.t1
MDRSFVHAPRQKNQGPQQQQGPPLTQYAAAQNPSAPGPGVQYAPTNWYPNWQDGQQSNSPRTKQQRPTSRRKSPRSSKQDGPQQPSMPVPMPPMVPLYPQMMPQMQQMAVPPMQQGVQGQVSMVGQVPMAPPALPPPDTPWTAAAMHQALPAVPVMPAMPVAPVSVGVQNSPSPEEVQELLQMMKARQSELPSDMQQKLQKMTVKTRARLTKDHHSAVTLHSKAREEFDNAISARSQLLANWKAFIGDAVRLWQGYAQNFAEQERNLQTRIANAKDNVIAAKEELDKANKQDEIQEIASDEEYGDMDTSSSTKVRQNIECLANSLQILEKEAAEMVEAEAHVNKRARKESPKAPQAPDGTSAHFGEAG